MLLKTNERDSSLPWYHAINTWLTGYPWPDERSTESSYLNHLSAIREIHASFVYSPCNYGWGGSKPCIGNIFGPDVLKNKSSWKYSFSSFVSYTLAVTRYKKQFSASNQQRSWPMGIETQDGISLFSSYN